MKSARSLIFGPDEMDSRIGGQTKATHVLTDEGRKRKEMASRPTGDPSSIS